MSHDQMEAQLDLLAESMSDVDIIGMMRKVKKMIFEYSSQNSTSEILN